MPGLKDVIPSREMVLEMPTEKLAGILLSIVGPHRQRSEGMFLPHIVGQISSGQGFNHFGYVVGNDRAVEGATAEAWQWLERAGLVLPAAPPNGANGFRVLSRDGEKIAINASDRAQAYAISRAAYRARSNSFRR